MKDLVIGEKVTIVNKLKNRRGCPALPTHLNKFVFEVVANHDIAVTVRVVNHPSFTMRNKLVVYKADRERTYAVDDMEVTEEVYTESPADRYIKPYVPVKYKKNEMVGVEYKLGKLLFIGEY